MLPPPQARSRHRSLPQQHQYSLTAFSYAAELARLQGDNSIWTALSNRLSAGYDYQWSAFNGGVTCSSCSCQPCSLSSNVYPRRRSSLEEARKQKFAVHP